MSSVRLFTFVSTLATLLACCEGAQYPYPTPRRDMSVFDDYHGTKVYDPYRWLENPKSLETNNFIVQQNSISGSFFDKCKFGDAIKEKITSGANSPRSRCTEKAGNKYYYYHNTGLQNQDVLYVQDTLDSEGTPFLDPNKLSEDGTTALTYLTSFTKDGSLFAYGLSEGGSDWMTIKVRDTRTKQDLPDKLTNIKFTGFAWTNDNRGFFYSTYPKVEENTDGTDTTARVHHTLYYHRLNTPQSQDTVAFQIPEKPNWMIHGYPADDGQYLVVDVSEGTGNNTIFVADLTSPNNGIDVPLKPIQLNDDLDGYYRYVTNVGDDFIIKTNKDAALNRLVRVNINRPQYENWKTLIAEDKNGVVLKDANRVNNKLVVKYLDVAKSVLRIHNVASGAPEHTVGLDLGTVYCLSGRADDTEAFFDFTSFLQRGSGYRLDMNNYQVTVIRESQSKGFNRENFEVNQIFYKSYDGTKVPMFIVHRKNLPMTGDHPLILYGYGGFDVSITPSYSTATTVFLQNMGGIYAVASIRGGGEYGERWHRGGMLENKQNVFDDFQAAAEYLIKEGYTNKRKLVINGGSNGGLLVGACLNQRPDLYGAGIAQVGVMDMLRFQKFSIGRAWVPEYGSSEDPVQFKWLYKYSPLHNIPDDTGKGQYPSTLLLTADKDDRVSPLHSLKFIAELQYKLANKKVQTNPLLIYVDTDSGHGAGKSTSKQIEESANIYSFLCGTIGLEWSDN